MTRFEYDPAKSASNLEKQGIDFEEAQRLWQDDRLAIVAARDGSEPRFIAIGRIGDASWAAVFTLRGTRLRLISVRRAAFRRSKAMNASDFDKAFDDGEDIDHLIDWSSMRRPNLERRRMEIDVPSWLADDVDAEARRLGLTSQALLQRWITEKLY